MCVSGIHSLQRVAQRESEMQCNVNDEDSAIDVSALHYRKGRGGLFLVGEVSVVQCNYVDEGQPISGRNARGGGGWFGN